MSTMTEVLNPGIDKPESNNLVIPESWHNLKPYERDILLCYYDKYSDTYGNKTKSVLKADPSKSYTQASQYGCELLRKPKIKAAITDLLTTQKTSLMVRLKTLGDILGGDHRTQTQYQDKSGDIVQTITTTPSARDKIQAADQLNKIDGTYLKQETRYSVMRKEWGAIAKSMLRDTGKKTPGKEPKTTILEAKTPVVSTGTKDTKQKLSAKVLVAHRPETEQVVSTKSIPPTIDSTQAETSKKESTTQALSNDKAACSPAPGEIKRESIHDIPKRGGLDGDGW